jgi:putative Ca2+/H+ antiporter (TMEM165/GDT1 family)
VEDLSTSSSRFSDELDKARDSGFEIPDRVDSVMTDREGHAKGKDSLDGTEGGISTKERNKVKSGSEKDEKKPEAPKEVSEHHEHEKEKVLKGTKKDVSESKTPGKAAKEKSEKGIGGLEVSDQFTANSRHGELTRHTQKPADLPDKPHDIPHPKPVGYSDGATSDEPISSHKTASDIALEKEGSGVIQPFHSFVLSLTMILVSEIGDKTFLIAALMAMRHDRALVFTAAFGALVVMTVLSAVLGHAVPTLIPERLTHFAAAILFLIFGTKMMKEGLGMDPNEGVGEEMKEVEMELEEKEHDMAARASKRSNSNANTISPYALESGRGRRSRSDSRLPAPHRSPSSSPSRSPSPSATSLKSVIDGLSNLFSLLLSPAWVQTFVMTFLGEWGDRSQIATIAMAAGNDYLWVILGSLVGHACCTGVAVVGGKAIAGKVSLRVGKLSHSCTVLFRMVY